MSAIERELLERFHALDAGKQRRVLDFVRQLETPEGELGRDFVARTSHIKFPKEDLDDIARIIEEDEERIDWDDWNNPPAFPNGQ